MIFVVYQRGIRGKMKENHHLATLPLTTITTVTAITIITSSTAFITANKVILVLLLPTLVPVEITLCLGMANKYPSILFFFINVMVDGLYL